MNERAISKTHITVWIVGILSLIWHLMGCGNYLWQMSMDPSAVESMTEAQRAIIETRPAWATAAFAVAVFGGAIGSVLLLMRRSSALIFFLLSLLGVIISLIPAFGIVNSGVTFSPMERVMYLIMTPLVGAFLLWYTRYALRCGWIGNGSRNGEASSAN